MKKKNRAYLGLKFAFSFSINNWYITVKSDPFSSKSMKIKQNTMFSWLFLKSAPKLSQNLYFSPHPHPLVQAALYFNPLCPYEKRSENQKRRKDWIVKIMPWAYNKHQNFNPPASSRSMSFTIFFLSLGLDIVEFSNSFWF